jgi:GNAT superfamily N-acetyltransferase
MLAAMLIREATPSDWPAMWAFMEGIVRAGETFSWDRDTTEAMARQMWFPEPPGRTFVAVDADGTVLGTANSVRNHGGGAAHISSASFMVDPRHSGRGVGRALGEHVLEQARRATRRDARSRGRRAVRIGAAWSARHDGTTAD